ncbi:MAG: DUF4388 domain-containing protein [Myxococcales bacterium]|nr:DUF4388 domain-containing protein [Myxococcales bacterium]
MTLTSLLHALHADERSGWLRVDDEWVVVLVHGEIVAASSSEERGLPAIQALLLRTDGTFTFERGDPQDAPPLAPMMSLILESARLNDEWRRLSPMVLEIRDRQKLGEIDSPELAALAPEIDGKRTVAELVHIGSLAPVQVIDAILAGLSRKALRCVARDHRLALSEPDADFFTLIDRARDHVRAGDLDSAEVALHRALSLRPGDRLARQNLRRLLALASNSRLERKSR